jgi:hypothetical protein
VLALVSDVVPAHVANVELGWSGGVSSQLID